MRRRPPGRLALFLANAWFLLLAVAAVLVFLAGSALCVDLFLTDWQFRVVSGVVSGVVVFFAVTRWAFGVLDDLDRAEDADEWEVVPADEA